MLRLYESPRFGSNQFSRGSITVFQMTCPSWPERASAVWLPVASPARSAEAEDQRVCNRVAVEIDRSARAFSKLP